MPYHTTTTTFTLFCPPDHAFFKSKYHVVPFKFDKPTTEASFGHVSKVDAPLPGHPIIITSLPGSTHTFASLNRVEVTEWDVNNGQLIVHGVQEFFSNNVKPYGDAVKYAATEVCLIRWPWLFYLLSKTLNLQNRAGTISRTCIHFSSCVVQVCIAQIQNSYQF